MPINLTSFNLLKRKLVKAQKLFIAKNVSTIAGSCTYYMVLSFIPLIVLLLNICSLVAIKGQENYSVVLLGFIEDHLPEISTSLIGIVEKIISLQYANGGELSVFNFIVLVIFSLSIFSSLLKGIEIIREKEAKTIERKLKSILGIALTVIFIGLIAFVIPLLKWIMHYLKDSSLWEIEVISGLDLTFIQQVLFFMGDSLLGTFLLEFIQIIIFIGFFTFFYHWLLSRKKTSAHCLLAASVFALLFFLGKYALMAYLKWSESNFLANYGEFYTIVVFMMWVFFLMNFFFYGVCIVLAAEIDYDR